jgi:flotillin
MRRRAVEGAENQAKVEVAAARMTGEIGESEKQSIAKQRIAQIDAQTAINESIRKKEKETAEADLAKAKVQLNMQIEISKIEAKRAAEFKDAELQKNLEIQRADTEYERLRATDLTKMRIKREKIEQEADAELYAAKKKADGEFYAQQRQAEAMQLTRRLQAEAKLYEKQQEAQGLEAVYKAQQEGFLKLKDAFGSDEGLMKFLMLEKGTFLQLAQANASAIQGLNPKINIWNTGI